MGDEEEGRDLARLAVPLAGALEETGDRWVPFRLTDPAGAVVEPVSAFFADVLAAGRSEGDDPLVWDGPAALVPVLVGGRGGVEHGHTDRGAGFLPVDAGRGEAREAALAHA